MSSAHRMTHLCLELVRTEHIHFLGWPSYAYDVASLELQYKEKKLQSPAFGMKAATAHERWLLKRCSRYLFFNAATRFP